MTHRIPKEIADKIDLLIKEGYYKNKSQVVINGIHLLLEKHNIVKISDNKMGPVNSMQQINTPILSEYYREILTFNFKSIIEVGKPVPINDLEFNNINEEYHLTSEISKIERDLLKLRKFEHLKNNGVEPVLEDNLSPRFFSIEITKNGVLRINYGLTSFFKTLITNYSSDVFVLNWMETLRRKYLTITDLAENKFPFSDQIGTGTIYITRDNYLILGKRSALVIESPGKITHTVGGFADLVKDTIDGEFHLRHTIFRESKEELGVNKAEIKNIFLLGVGRDLRRGGLPDFQFLGELSITYSEVLDRIKEAKDAWETTNIIGFDLNSIPTNMNDFLSGLLETQIHNSLGFGISCWIKQLKNKK